MEVRNFGSAQPGPLLEKGDSGPAEKTQPLMSREATRTPKITEEPKADVRKTGGKILVDIHLPEVKSENDIQIRPLENSIEVKAFSGDKAYFKIITKPAGSAVARKPFSRGILRLERS